MITSRLVVVVPFLLSSLTLFACSETVSSGAEKESTSPALGAADGGAGALDTRASEQGAVDVCARTCARRVTCDPATDADTCTSKCENANGTYLSKVRAEYAAELATCIDKSACKNLDDGSAFGDCGAEARARLSPSSTATGFCDDYAAASTKCGVEIDKATCFDLMKTYSDASLSDATKCFGKKCSDISACVGAAFATSVSDPPPPPPPPPPPATTCSPVPGIPTACSSCIAALCCAEQQVCERSSTCTSYFACTRSCTTPACRTSCETSYPSGKSAFDSVASCAASSCPASCSGGI